MSAATVREPKESEPSLPDLLPSRVMNSIPDRHEQRLALLGMQLLEEFQDFEDAIVAMAAVMPAEEAEIFAEFAIDQVLVDFARSTRSPEAPKVHIALGRRLRAGVHRRLALMKVGPATS